jgi:hypothetical protein
MAAGCRELLVRFASRMTPRAAEISIEGPVLLFTLGVSVFVGLALGLVPALSSRRSLVGALQEGRDTAAPAEPPRAASQLPRRGAGRDLVRPARGRRVDAADPLEDGADRPRLQDERVLTSRLDLNFSRYPTRTRGATSRSACSSGCPRSPASCPPRSPETFRSTSATRSRSVPHRGQARDGAGEPPQAAS